MVARQLSQKLDANKYDLILINNRRERIWQIAAPRMAVTTEGGIQEQAFLPYDRVFHNGNGIFKLGTVTHISKTEAKPGGHIILEDGETIPFHVLVLATGSNWTGPVDFPIKSEEIGPFLEKSRQNIRAAEHIVLVGGGAVGLGECQRLSSITVIPLS